jgi:hypothetical protein
MRKIEYREKMKGKRIILVLGVFMIFLINSYQVSAYAVGASPASLSFSVPRDGYEEKTFQVSTNSETPLEFSFSVSDSINANIEVKTKDKTTVQGKPAEITVIAHASRSAKPASLDGAINVNLKSIENNSGGTGSQVSTGVAVRIGIEITGETSPLFKNKIFLISTGLVVILIILTVIFKFRKKSRG